MSLSWICSSAVKCVFAIANANSRGDFIERDRARVDPIRGDALDSPQRSGSGHPSARLERADVLQWRGIGSGGNATATNCRFIGGAEMLATLARVALALFLVVIVYRMVQRGELPSLDLMFGISLGLGVVVAGTVWLLWPRLRR